MAELDAIVKYLEAELKTAEIKDYPGAVNGLQLENDGRIDRVVSAVDASVAVILEAARVPNTLLLVHHGMFWQGVQPITAAFYRKIGAAIRGNLAIYSSHLPLDMHPEIGNNILLAQAIGLKSPKPALHRDGWPVAIVGEWSGNRTDLEQAVASAVNRSVTVCPAGPDLIKTVAIITGGAGSEIQKIADLGVDAFVTGEGQHWSFVLAEELGVNVFYAGHYATEVFGVKELGKRVGARAGIPASFIEREGGL